jgi:hypothetical protein
MLQFIGNSERVLYMKTGRSFLLLTNRYKNFVKSHIFAVFCSIGCPISLETWTVSEFWHTCYKISSACQPFMLMKMHKHFCQSKQHEVSLTWPHCVQWQFAFENVNCPLFQTFGIFCASFICANSYMLICTVQSSFKVAFGISGFEHQTEEGLKGRKYITLRLLTWDHRNWSLNVGKLEIK